MLGKDADKSEYWHFKDDNTRIYIRTEEEILPTMESGDTVMMAAEEGAAEDLRV